ncbi:hypothetical protein EJD96_17260 [Herbaspirillum seropedicae]|nr:hypothetical protein EJD96_17260 [Herbaspirillum seropedicae]
MPPFSFCISQQFTLACLPLCWAGRSVPRSTGRTLSADASTRIIFLIISVAAFCRIAATLSLSNAYLLQLSALCWALAFLLFVARYGAWLLRPRLR